jgi:hypothetical protein
VCTTLKVCDAVSYETFRDHFVATFVAELYLLILVISNNCLKIKHGKKMAKSL